MSFFSEERANELRAIFFESAQELLQALNEEGLQPGKSAGRRGDCARHQAHGSHLEGRFGSMRLQ